MIVICTKCQAKFRVPDEKVGPRGAKLRCSRCQTVFVVQPPAAARRAASAGTELDLEPGTGDRPARRPAPPQSPFARANVGAPPQRPSPPPASAVALAPPFPAAMKDDPFAAAAAARARDPFAPAPPADPFAGADPFAADAAPRATLPVTDLSDLLGAPGAQRGPSIPPPLPAAAAPARAPEPPPPHGDPELGPPAPAADPFELAPSPSPDPFALAAAGAAAGGAAAAADDGGLALEDRSAPVPILAGAHPAALPEPEAALADPFAGGAPFDPGSFDYAGESGEPALALAAEGPAGAAPRERTPEPLSPPAPAPPAPERAARASAEPRPPAEERIPGQRSSRIRAVLVNAVALAALLVVTLAMLVAWRSDGSVDPASLGPAAVLRILRGGAVEDGPFFATQVRSGAYERARGAPLLFVSGRAVSRAGAPVAALAVSVEVVRGPEVIARGEAVAGAVPTPEELHGATDAGALAEVVTKARSRAPAQVNPGDAVPFVVAIDDAPAELDGASLRVQVAPRSDARAEASR
jgi:predicted Zn finger-like uncharacterized protein